MVRILKPKMALLEEAKPKVFRIMKFAEEGAPSIKEISAGKKNLFLVAKSCDGNFHKVNSELPEILEKNRERLEKGMIEKIANEITPDENMHGKRFIVFKNKGRAFLLGDVFTALEMLGK